ncbi:MAG TPA: ribonuclease catalytic domain-containing protein, partial [Rubrivivax sp.]|nr:ribonuclease catalytic domain-containing protein [Rubrivivax sp.]
MKPTELAAIAAQEMRDHGLQPHFEPAALAQAQRAAAGNSAAAMAGPSGDIRDLRTRLWFSIDNVDTRDLDQLSWAQEQADGGVLLAVAIADVDALVPRGSAADAHAAHNTTSVYTAAGVFAMLPPLLSNDLSSLHEGQDRLAVVVEMRVAADGTVGESQLFRAAVRNQAKLDYDSVAHWLEGDGPAPQAVAASQELQAQLHLHDQVAARLRRWRYQRGALNVSTVQASPVFDEGQLVDLRADHKNRAKDLIADIMIATNSASARFLVARGEPTIRRVLQQPRRWDRLVQLAAGHGHDLAAA